MFDFVEDTLNTTQIQKFQKQRLSLDPVLYRNYNSEVDKPNVTILTDTYLTEKQLWRLKEFIYNNTKNKYLLERTAKYCDNHQTIKSQIKLQILSVLPFQPTKKDTSKEVVDFYINHKIKLSDYIPKNSVIVCMGRSLYSIIESNDLDIYGFQDIVFNKSYFYDSHLNCTVFPIWDFNKLYGKSFEMFFSYLQIVRASYFKPIRVPIDYITRIKVDNPNVWLQEYLYYKDITSFDIETKYLDPWNPDSRILCLTFSFDGKTGYYLRFKDCDKYLLEKFFENKKLIGTNIGYDIKFMVVRGKLNRDNFHIHADILQLGHLLNKMRRNGLKSNTWNYTTNGGYDRPLTIYLNKYPKCKNDYSLIPESILSDYAIDDACNTMLIYQRMMEQVHIIDQQYFLNKSWTMERYYFETVIPFIKVFIDIELNGTNIDWGKLNQVSIEFAKDRQALKEELYKLFNATEKDFDIDSGESLGKYLEHIGWNCIEKAKKGYYKTNEACLKLWIKNPKYAVIAKKIALYRSMGTIYHTFLGDRDATIVKEKNKKAKIILNKFDFINNALGGSDVKISKDGYWKYQKSDNKVHPNFGVMLCNTDRNFCKNPNLQNNLSNSEHAKKYVKPLRSFFSTPSEDYYIGEFDGAGLQLRICAILSNDEGFREAFTKLGSDLHGLTAYNVFIKNRKIKYIIINTDNGELKYKEHDKLKIKRNNVIIEIEAKDIKESDEIV